MASGVTENDRALIDAIRQQLPKANIPARAASPKHDLEQWLKKIPSPDPPRLRKHIFGLGSVYAVSIPEDVYPWIGWLDLTLEQGATIDGNAGVFGAFRPDSNNDTVTLGASAALGGPEYGSNDSGGQATGWAYQGQYFTATAVSESGAPLIPNETYLTVSANPSINFSWNWSTYLFANAAVSLSAGFLIQVFPPGGSMQTLWGPQTYLYQRNQNTGGDDNQSNGPQFFPISFDFPVNAGYSYGVFVQYIASAQGDGQSPGAWVPGSFGTCGLTSTLAAIQYKAICNQP